MDEEVTIIDSNTRNEKIKNFFINNKKNLIIGFSIILVVIIGYLSINEIKSESSPSSEGLGCAALGLKLSFILTL